MCVQISVIHFFDKPNARVRVEDVVVGIEALLW